MLDSDRLQDRLTSIDVPGDMGDEEPPKALRTQMVLIDQGYQALVNAIRKLERKLGVQ